jgi:uncharacterized membrane protein
MLALILGSILFFGVHSVQIIRPGIRQEIVDRKGVNAWKGPYALIAIIGLVLIVYGYGEARQTSALLYAPPPQLRHLALLLLVPVFPLLIAAYVPGRIKAAVRHPMLVATIIWAFAHLLVNGSVADVWLFGLFLVWATVDLVSVVSRGSDLAHTLPSSRYNDLIAIAAGLVIYALFITHIHRWITGVSPI